MIERNAANYSEYATKSASCLGGRLRGHDDKRGASPAGAGKPHTPAFGRIGVDFKSTTARFVTALMLLITTTSSASYAQFAPQPADKYAAIAFSPVSGRHTDASDRTSRAAAEQAAIAQCRQDGSTCSAPVWVQNGCVALAIGNARGFGSGWGSDRASAERQALDVCSFKARGCSIQRSACTGN